MKLTVGTQLVGNAGGPDKEIAEVIKQPTRPGMDVYRLTSGGQLYTKAYLLRHNTIKVV